MPPAHVSFLKATATDLRPEAARPAPVDAVDAPPRRRGQRLQAIDALRGLAIAAMSLRHVAFFMRGPFQAETYGGQPAQLMSWPHWVSGLLLSMSAPTFWFLAGLSVRLMVAKHLGSGRSEQWVTRHMLRRAVILLVLDVTVCDWFWSLAQPPVAYTHVLLSIAVSLAMLSVLRRLPVWAFATLLLCTVVGYQVWLGSGPAALDPSSRWWTALLIGHREAGWPAIEFSLAGWFPLIGAGYLLGGRVVAGSMTTATSWARLAGALLLGWFALRLSGGFGDLVPFAAGDEWYRFLILGKTPPALTYLLFYIGVACMALAVLRRLEAQLSRAPFSWLVALGNASLFIFVAHIALYSPLTRLARMAEWPAPRIVVTYAVFAVGLAVLIPAAHWYAGLRRRYPGSPYLP
jgi:uncharacterized membrane protein